MNEKSFQKVSSFHNELDIFIPYSFLRRDAWYVYSRPILGKRISQFIEIVIPSLGIKRPYMIFSFYFINNVWIIYELRGCKFPSWLIFLKLLSSILRYSEFFYSFSECILKSIINIFNIRIRFFYWFNLIIASITRRIIGNLNSWFLLIIFS